MPDYGSMIAERAIGTVNRRLRTTYRTAAKELKSKLADFARKHEAKEKIMLDKLAQGLITQDDLDKWRIGQVFMEKQWKDKIDQCTRILTNANKEAALAVHQSKLDVFAENYNHAAYELEKTAGNLGFETYNTQTVAKLVKSNPKMLPKWKIDEPKDYKWNQKKVNNCIRQGIIQGESINQITDRLVITLITQNENKMRTFARTAMTGAQNAGRQKQMEDAEDMGIKVKKRWLATLDDRTRDTHQDLDGQEVPVDEPFTVDVDGKKEEIEFPGDPNAEPCLVFNCRCTMIQVYEGVERKSVRRDDEDNLVENMTYKEWQEWKKGEMDTEKSSALEEEIQHIVQGKDITSTWERREDEFQFEIQDAINAQGFDGVPQVVSQEEFDKAVEESGIIGQRGYNAPSEEALKEYENALYNGDFYVECSGGSVYGKGMYTSISLDGTITEDMQKTAEHYSSGIGKVETFTVQQDTKLVQYDALMEEFTGRRLYGKMRDEMLAGITKDEMPYVLAIINEAPYTKDVMSIYRTLSDARLDEIDNRKVEIFGKAIEKSKEMMKKTGGDIGTFAALRGYDGTLCNNDKFAVIYNRTKLIFLGGK